jgi:hypothetical protein
MRTLGTLIAPALGAPTVAGNLLRLENGVEILRRVSITPESPGPREADRLRPGRVGRAAIGCSLAPMADDFVVVP